jgi:ribulose-phosphate 3-epimerase
LIALKPKTIIFHAEVQEDLGPILQKVRAAGIHAGVALLKPTVPSTVTPYIQIADHVLVFSGDLGHYGGTASLMQLEKVRLIHAIRNDLEIGWDGGANIENAYTLAQGGVNVINAGGAINKAQDPTATYNKMVEEINKRSVI